MKKSIVVLFVSVFGLSMLPMAYIIVSGHGESVAPTAAGNGGQYGCFC